MKTKAGEQILRLHIEVASPPAGVWFAVQRGREELLPPEVSAAGALRFSFALRVSTQASGLPNFLGEFAQGPASERFVYVNSGTKVREPGAQWERRAKLLLSSIPQGMLARALVSERAALEASFKGTAKDGGAVCASLPASHVRWSLVQDVA